MSGWKKWKLPTAAGIGLGCAALLTPILCAPGAWIAARGTLPLGACPYWAACAAFLAVFLPVFFIAGARKRQALPTGGAVAGGYAAIALILSLVCGNATGGAWLGRVVIAVFAGGALGAVMSIRQNPHKKRRR